MSVSHCSPPSTNIFPTSVHFEVKKNTDNILQDFRLINVWMFLSKLNLLNLSCLVCAIFNSVLRSSESHGYMEKPRRTTGLGGRIRYQHRGCTKSNKRYCKASALDGSQLGGGVCSHTLENYASCSYLTCFCLDETVRSFDKHE